jgi:mitogen-activated protein kinase kinase kinase 7
MRVAALLVSAATASGVVHGQTITFRSLVESSSSSSAASDEFVFDGTNSDIAQQLYIRHHAGDTADAVALTSIPPAVTNRLHPLKLDFSDLPGLVQRAVLWDSGFALSPDNDPVQIWTMADYTMASIAVPQADITEVNCTTLECPQPNDVAAFSAQYCSGTQILNVSRCVADTFSDSGSTNFLGVMWSTGGDADMTPHIRLREHSWTEPTTGTWYSVYAIHTVSSADDPTWNQCPADGGFSSLIVPCHRRSEFSDEEMATMATPTGSSWVTTWLEDEFVVQDAGFNELLLIPILLGSFVVIAAIACGWFWWRRREEQEKSGRGSSNDFEDGSPLPYLAGNSDDLGLRPTMMTSQPSTLGPSFSDYESAGSNQTLKILLSSQHLKGKRISYESLTFLTAVSNGASGEVCVCEYLGRQVAAKRLLHAKDQKADKVQEFAEEIELTASLSHPHIVTFIGVAWNSLNNLIMVLEYVPGGDLHHYLVKNADLLSWVRDKIYMAIGVAQALGYLHGRSAPVIHRDLKSSNILLTRNLEPKLIDFGVSRGILDVTMTAGVGTPYWTAPEILEGKRYTEMADIYSFGVVLSELDTGRVPFYDAVTDDGDKLMPFQILQGVMAGTLRASFSDECPSRIRRVGNMCLALDPATRPTALEVVQELEGRDSQVT